MKKLFFIFCVLFFSVACANVSFPKLPRLSDSEIKNLLANKVIFINHIAQFERNGIFTGGMAQVVAFYKNGTQRGLLVYPRGNQQMDAGNWTVKNDLLCASWQHWQQGKQHCLYWYFSRNHFFLFDTKGQLQGVIYKNNIR